MEFAGAVAVGALTIWLIVRIANRRERWPKWAGAALALLFVYPLSFGPACWMSSRGLLPESVGIVYKPLLYALADVRQGFGTDYDSRPGWRQLVDWGQLHDGGPWHRSNWDGHLYQNTIAMHWATIYARQIRDWSPQPRPITTAEEPDNGIPHKVVAEFIDGTKVVLAGWLTRADAKGIRLMAYSSEDREFLDELVDVRIEPQDGADIAE